MGCAKSKECPGSIPKLEFGVQFRDTYVRGRMHPYLESLAQHISKNKNEVELPVKADKKEVDKLTEKLQTDSDGLDLKGVPPAVALAALKDFMSELPWPLLGSDTAWKNACRCLEKTKATPSDRKSCIQTIKGATGRLYPTDFVLLKYVIALVRVIALNPDNTEIREEQLKGAVGYFEPILNPHPSVGLSKDQTKELLIFIAQHAEDIFDSIVEEILVPPKGDQRARKMKAPVVMCCQPAFKGTIATRDPTAAAPAPKPIKKKPPPEEEEEEDEEAAAEAGEGDKPMAEKAKSAEKPAAGAAAAEKPEEGADPAEGAEAEEGAEAPKAEAGEDEGAEGEEEGGEEEDEGAEEEDEGAEEEDEGAEAPPKEDTGADDKPKKGKAEGKAPSQEGSVKSKTSKKGSKTQEEGDAGGDTGGEEGAAAAPIMINGKPADSADVAEVELYNYVINNMQEQIQEVKVVAKKY